MHRNKIIGNFGEELACHYLVRNGYKIIEKNYRHSYLEIDIIAKINSLLTFIEVKTRTNVFLGLAEDSLSWKKTENINRAIRCYLEKNNIYHENIRFDLIAIDINKQKKSAHIKHFKDII